MAEKNMTQQLLEQMMNSAYGSQNAPSNKTAFDEALSFMQPQKANEFDIFTYNPSTIRAGMLNKSQQKMQDKARNMVPDSGSFIKSIMDKDLYYGTEQKYTNALSGMANTYLKNYSENPYYAFSKEAKSLASQMQGVVTDPSITAHENLKKETEDIKTMAKDKDLWYNPVVNNGRVKVVRDNDFKWVKPSNVKPTDEVVTVGQDYAYVEAGAKNNMKVDMSSYEDVWDKITESMDNLGTTETVNLFGKTKVSSKSQKEQQKQRKEWLTNQGLTKEDYNTLTSEYLRKNGVPESDAHLQNWVFDNIENYMSSATDETNVNASNTVANPDGTVANIPESSELVANKNYIQEALMGGPSAYSVISSPDSTQAEKDAIKAESDATVKMMPDALKKYLNNNKITQDIVKPVSSNTLTLHNDYFKNEDGEVTNIDNKQIPLADNEYVQRLKASGAKIETPDGVELDLETTIPDPSQDSFIVEENGTFYMYMPVITSDENWNSNMPEELEDSPFIGSRNENGSYDNERVGEMNDRGGIGKYYTHVIEQTNPDVDDLLYGGLAPNEEIYQGMVKFELAEDYPHQALILDGGGMYSRKQENMGAQNKAAAQNKPATNYAR